MAKTLKATTRETGTKSSTTGELVTRKVYEQTEEKISTVMTETNTEVVKAQITENEVKRDQAIADIVELQALLATMTDN